MVPTGDIAQDDGFSWLGTDNDQTQGDRLLMPFFGAHFGWGHRYSSHWSGDGNLPTAPVSGPMFPGSGAGIIYYAHPHFPPDYQHVFIINDWLNGTHIYRPSWDGTLMRPEGGILEPFARRGGGKLLYRTTDLEFGPNGRLYICGWGGGYDYETGAEGSWIFRVTYGAPVADWTPDEKRARAVADRPALRKLYLKMIARTSFSNRDDGLDKVQSFYESLNDDEERAIVLPALASSIDVRELFWDAFGGSESLRRAAVKGWHQMQDGAVPGLDSDEEDLLEELAEVMEKAQSSGDPGDAATWLLSKLVDAAGPADERVTAVAEVLGGIVLPPGWSPPPRSEAVLAAILNEYGDSLIRTQVLSFLSRIEPRQFANLKPIQDAIRRLSSQPNPRLYAHLVNLIEKLGFSIEVPAPEPATSAGVFATLAGANPEQGRDLFFKPDGGAGCAVCHGVAGQGGEFAPDLSGVGLRLSAENIIQSILEPSAATTEGYAMHVLETVDGHTHFGAVIQETHALIKLVRADGTPVTVESEKNTKRQKLDQSVMPAAYAVFGDEQLADLTAWLLTLRDGVSKRVN